MKTILVVSDYTIVLEGLQKVLSRRGFKVIKARTSAEALSFGTSLDSIGLFLIDLALKGEIDGLGLVESLRSQGNTQPAIIYAINDDVNRILTLAEADVEGIVTGGDDLRELITAVRMVEAGERYRSVGLHEKIEHVRQTLHRLSAKDIEVLQRLSGGQSNREIAAAMVLSEKTVEYHRSNILKKLGVRTMLEATRMALSLGIIE